MSLRSFCNRIMGNSRDIDRTAFVLVNAHAGMGRDEAYREELIALFRQHGFSAEVHLARGGSDTERLFKEAADSTASIVVAGGGDGTINGLVNAIRGREKVLGVLPLGTFNHFAKDLGLPLDLPGAVEVICTGAVQSVDYAEVNGHAFVNNSGLGLYPQMVHQREQQQRLGRSKWAAAIWAALAVWRRFPFVRVHLKADEREFKSRTPLIFVGNNQYQIEGLMIGGRGGLTDGKLSVYLTKRTGRWGLVVLALRALFGRLRGVKDFIAMSTKEMRIETDKRKLKVAVDGEIMELTPPLQYSIRAGALRVMVPRSETAEIS